MEMREEENKATAVLIVGRNAAAADLALTVLSVLGPQGFLVPDIGAASAHLNDQAAETAAVLVDGESEGDLTGEEFARFVAIAWPHIRVGLICSPRNASKPPPHERVAILLAPILPLQLITFLQDFASESLAGV